MKRLTLFVLSLMIGCAAFGQQKTKYMIITINQFNGIIIGHTPNFIITRTDSAQVAKYVDLKTHTKLKDELAANENMLMQLIKPYLDNGWKLVSTSVDGTFSANNDNKFYRYYLSKE